jgi:hypothetical protein
MKILRQKIARKLRAKSQEGNAVFRILHIYKFSIFHTRVAEIGAEWIGRGRETRQIRRPSTLVVGRNSRLGILQLERSQKSSWILFVVFQFLLDPLSMTKSVEVGTSRRRWARCFRRGFVVTRFFFRQRLLRIDVILLLWLCDFLNTILFNH